LDDATFCRFDDATAFDAVGFGDDFTTGCSAARILAFCFADGF
jgi:hypothetical protein